MDASTPAPAATAENPDGAPAPLIPHAFGQIVLLLQGGGALWAY